MHELRSSQYFDNSLSGSNVEFIKLADVWKGFPGAIFALRSRPQRSIALEIFGDKLGVKFDLL